MARYQINATGGVGARQGDAPVVPGAGTGTYILHNGSDSTVRTRLQLSSVNETATFPVSNSVDVEFVDNGANPDHHEIVMQRGSTIVFTVAKSDAGDGNVDLVQGRTATTHGTVAQNGEFIYIDVLTIA